MGNEYSTRKFSHSDVEGVVQLMNLVFKPQIPFTKEWWSWKYESNPACFGCDTGIWVAEDEGMIVGHYAVIPYRIQIGNKIIIAAQSVDTAVHLEYRRLGMFSELAKKTYTDVSNRFQFLFGFPSEMAFKGFVGLGWKDYRINELVKFVNYDRSLRSFLSNRLKISGAKAILKTLQATKRVRWSNFIRNLEGEDINMNRINGFDETADGLWETIQHENEVILERTASFLNWRFSKKFGDYQIWAGLSKKDGKMVGYIVLRRTSIRSYSENVLDIVDLIALPKQDKFIINATNLAQQISKQQGFDVIHVRVPVWHRYAKILYSQGFINIGSVLNSAGSYHPRFILYDFNGAHSAPDVQKFFYSLADTDYA
jgi:hypothetical protein